MTGKNRILAVQEILQRYSDETHFLSTAAIQEHLQNDYALPDVYRKRINEDIAALEDFYPQSSYLYIHKSGYSLSSSPFSLAEAKILLDALEALRDLPPEQKELLKQKITSFLSVYEEKFLSGLAVPHERKKSPFLYHLETVLAALQKQESLFIRRRRKEEKEEIVPLFIDRTNDKYYLLYAYPGRKKIYRLRFDNLLEVIPGGKQVLSDIPREKILHYLSEAQDAYHGEETETLRLRYQGPADLPKWLKEDFETISFYGKDEALLKSGINPRLFGRLAAYGTQLEILSPPEVREAYLAYLEEIAKIYRNNERRP
ncbi:MAG: WYL domain-containing protein [Erysipelotrichaceae bacterium]|nr:WYL domain-containing protein [Erysipelotrichaceae bacterium]